jgi:hypothetical protein
MADSQSLRGGAPTHSPVLANVDNETMFGTGSIQSPLRAEAQDIPPTTEHVAAASSSAALDPDVDISFVRYAAVVPEGGIIVGVTLPNGSVDGQRHVVVFAARNLVTWTLTASFQQITYPIGEQGAAVFVWDSTLGLLGSWRIASVYNGVVS